MSCPFNCEPILWPIIFFMVNVAILRVILWRSLKKDPTPDKARDEVIGPAHLDPKDILGLEFGYAQTTASEAMQDRHTMVNYYLIIVAVVSTGVIAVLGQDISKVAVNLPIAAGITLLWLLASVGSFYFLKIVRLREAWYGSVLAMIEIKEFYFRHSENLNGDKLREAFYFKRETLPASNKRWNVFFYSAMLIAFLNAVAYIAGGILIVASDSLANKSDEIIQLPASEIIVISIIGLGLFIFYGFLYERLLRPGESN